LLDSSHLAMSPSSDTFPYCTRIPSRGDYQCASLHIYLLFISASFLAMLFLTLYGWWRKRHPKYMTGVYSLHESMSLHPFLSTSITPSTSDSVNQPSSSVSSSSPITDFYRHPRFVSPLWIVIPSREDIRNSEGALLNALSPATV
ncbi:hypothetical protein PMAYCL1PPCAC_02593, partial [Pristionchus mayeri]